jgi:hypothetical protein
MPAPVLSLDITVKPPTLTVTFVLPDVTDAVNAMNAAIDQATTANAILDASQTDVEAAGRSAFVQKLIPLFYKQVELTQKGSTLSDAAIAADVEAKKAALDAEVSVLLDLRPVIKVVS